MSLLRIGLRQGASVLSFVALVLVGLGAVCRLVGERHRDLDGDALLSGQAFALTRMIDARRPVLMPFQEAGLEMERHGTRAELFDADGESLGRSAHLGGSPLGAEVRSVATARPGAVFEDLEDSKLGLLRSATWARVEAADGRRSAGFFVRVSMPSGSRAAAWRRAGSVLSATGVALFLGVLAVVRGRAEDWRRALVLIEEKARAIGAVNLGRERIPVPTSHPELSRLAQSFNSLLDRLDDAQSMQQRFAADASHELRTPLTILRGEIEVALRRPRSTEEYGEVLRSCREEIERLTRLTENLLTLASADAGEALVRREPVDLAGVAGAVVARHRESAAAKRVILEVVDGGRVEVHGDAVALERAVGNLVENAVRFAPAEERVRVGWGCRGGGAWFEVEDTGTGIAPEHLPRLFDRFFRVDKARSREAGGAGLGLSIVKVLVEAHGGTVAVDSTLGVGTRFVIRLPLAGSAGPGQSPDP